MTSRLAIVAAFLLVAPACSNGTGPSTADPLSASGTWSVWMTLTGYERPSGGLASDWHTMQCEGGVTMVLDDNHGTINGAFTMGNLSCTIDSTLMPVPWASPITGTRDKSAILFGDGLCVYQGTIIPDQAAGRIDCDTDTGSTEIRATGAWKADK
jgi:hypothetical protein